MNFENWNIKDLKLSGKGNKLETGNEWVHDNMKLISITTELHEVVNQNDERIGWIVLDDYAFYADMTVHTGAGMEGQTIKENIKESLIIDLYSKLEPVVGGLGDVDTILSTQILEKYKESNFGRNIRRNGHIKWNDHDDPILAILSHDEKLIFVQTLDTSIAISKSMGVMVLNRDKDSLTTVSRNEGVHVINHGNTKVKIGKDGDMILNGKEFNPKIMVSNILSSLSNGFSQKSSFHEDMDDFGDNIGEIIEDTFEDLDFDF